MNRSPKSKSGNHKPFSAHFAPSSFCKIQGKGKKGQNAQNEAEIARIPPFRATLRGNFRSEKSQNKSSPNFSNFSSRILPRILLRIFPRIFWGVFRVLFRGKRRPEKICQKSRHFSTRNSQANSKKKSTKVFCRVGKVRCPDFGRSLQEVNSWKILDHSL